MPKGTLIVNAKKQLRVKWTNVKGKAVEMAVPDAELSGPLASLKTDPGAIGQLDGREVELDEAAGQPKKIRELGQPWSRPVAPSPLPTPQRPGGGDRDPKHRKQPTPQRPDRLSSPAPAADFHNPYNFIPAIPRDRVTGELGDLPPAGHERYQEGRFSGVISVRLTTQSPLLLPDAAATVEYDGEDPAQGISKGHKSFPVRIDADGRPYLAPTSVKGMLRAAFEAVTNSRLGVFVGHDRELAYRMVTQEGLALVPARVEDGCLRLLMGTSGYGQAGPQGPMYAAWLPRYYRGRLDRHAVRYDDGKLPPHADAVTCWVELFQHWRWDRRRNQPVDDFQFWRVRTIARQGESAGPQPAPAHDPGQQKGRSYHQPLGQFRKVNGFVCITNANIDRKHDERVFFATNQNLPSIPLSERECRAWETLILNYQDEHRDEIARGRKSPPALNDSEWSRHVHADVREAKLEDGTLCYAGLRQRSNGWELTGLFPVNISRKLHEVSPETLVPPPFQLRPCETRERLSPAERVFGWVNQNGHGAYRGNLRIGTIVCESKDAIESFGEPGLPLAILGQPKPQQTRFYVAGSPQGDAQPNQQSKEAVGYRPGKGLRGRKVYPHHKDLPRQYWDGALLDKTQTPDNGHYQEFRRPRLNDQEQRDDQNRSIQGWVRPGTVFTFDVHVTNLSNVELGGLIWLLSLNDGLPEPRLFHRLGGGKPLGFGSVCLDVAGYCLRSADDWRGYYQSLEEFPPGEYDPTTAIEAFKQAVIDAYGNQTKGANANERFRQVSFIAAFCRAAEGFDTGLPIHYPRAREAGQSGPVPPHPEGRAYEWFVANDRTGRDPGPGLSLPDLPKDGGLPILPAPKGR